MERLLQKLKGTDGKLSSKYTFASVRTVTVRSRRYVAEFGTQLVSKALQATAQPQIVKLDLHKCFVTLAPQVLQKLSCTSKHIAFSGSAFRSLSSDPQRSVNKRAALRMLTGGRRGNLESASALEKEARVLQWLACSCLPDLHEAAIKEGRPNPASTCLSRLLEGPEDFCIESLVTFIQQRLCNKVTHLAWEFDGTRTPWRVSPHSSRMLRHLYSIAQASESTWQPRRKVHSGCFAAGGRASWEHRWLRGRWKPPCLRDGGQLYSVSSCHQCGICEATAPRTRAGQQDLP